MNRRTLRAGWLLLVLAYLAWTARAQQDYDKVEIQTIPVAGGIYMLVGVGNIPLGNIAVSTGDDGVLLVDAQQAPLHAKIIAAVQKISSKPIRFLINTHWHGDHTGGNELIAQAGVIIVAHDNVRKRMSTEQFMQDVNRRVSPSPKEALPIVTFNDTLTLHFNGDEIHVFHVAAQTDSDSVIYFRRANVIHVGDIYQPTYPRIDISSGGSIDGCIAALDRVLQLVNPKTKIIPGHGPLSTPQDLQDHRHMLSTVRDRVLSQLRAGKTLEQVIASKPTAEFDEKRRGARSPEDFVKMVYQSLSQTKQ